MKRHSQSEKSMANPTAEKHWDSVSRVESQGGKGNTGSKGEAALACPAVPRARDHTALTCPPTPSALEQVSTSEPFSFYRLFLPWCLIWPAQPSTSQLSWIPDWLLASWRLNFMSFMDSF